jgi:hypothetical protein
MAEKKLLAEFLYFYTLTFLELEVVQTYFEFYTQFFNHLNH